MNCITNNFVLLSHLLAAQSFNKSQQIGILIPEWFKQKPESRNLKGLSHEIDLKNFDKKFTELGLTKVCGWFLKFPEAPLILS
jgi:hypothetical protein